MTNTLKIATGFITGTFIGATLAILFAPKKGAETRNILSNHAKELTDSMGNAYEKTKVELGLKQKDPAA